MLLRLKSGRLESESIVVDLEFGMSNKRMDIDNPVKMTLDILCKKLGFDDSIIEMVRIKKTIVKKGKEFIWFRLSPN